MPLPRSHRRPRAGWWLLAGLAIAAPEQTARPAPPTPDRIAAAILRHEDAAAAAERDRRPAAMLGHWAAIARLDPTRTDAWERLEDGARTPPPLDSPALADARALLPRGFREDRTTHFVILTDADRAWSREVGRRLERVRADFEAFARRLQLDPMPLRHRLVCIVFADQRDFERFGREHDGVAAGWAHGYYSARRDRVVLYAPPPEHAGRGSADGDRFARDRAFAALSHETAHQLSYHQLVQDATVRYPLWLTEGLATSFESGEDDPRSGPWESFGPRERRLARLAAEDRLLPLDRFIALSSLGAADAERIELVYGQCYGLFSWLVTTRPASIRRFLRAMHQEPPGAVSPDRLRALFAQHVGPPAALQSAWAAHLDDRVRAEGRSRHGVTIQRLAGRPTPATPATPESDDA